MLRKAVLTAFIALFAVAPAAAAGGHAQRSIALPDEFRPEGIASGAGATFYVGSIPQGSVWRGSYETGAGSVLVPPHAGRNHIGLKWHRRSDQLFVAGGPSQGVFVYDAASGADAASYSIADAGFINDVALTHRAAYFTDSLVAQLYRVDIGRDGSTSAPQAIPISGDFVYQDGFNANGIVALPGGRTLLVVQTNTGKLFAVDARTGASREVPLDEPLVNGDGMLLRGRTLFVVQNEDNRIAVVRLKHGEGRVKAYLTDPLFDVPTTIAPFGPFLYAVNARFDRPDDSDDDVVRVRVGHQRK